MLIREEFEKREKESLSRFATLSTETRGRKKDEKSCPVRTEYQKDRDKILHSVSFRLLKHKTQVFLSTAGERFRTRLTHTMEVAAAASYMARALKVNEDLVEAIALGHDLGHTPFGHAGEDILRDLTPFSFRHAKQSLRVVDKLENAGKGLNLTYEVRNGIAGHSKGEWSVYKVHGENIKGQGKTSTIEGEVVQFADWIAYINHDVDDAFNMGIIKKEDLPASTEKVLGLTFYQRLITMIKDVVENSLDKKHITMSSEVMEATDELRGFLYRKVYTGLHGSFREIRSREMLSLIYSHYLENYEKILKEMPFLKNEETHRGVCDFVASLTDVRAQELYSKLKAKNQK